MAELCRFYGIIIQMMFNDIKQHSKPHIHVKYAEYKAVVGIDGELISGNLPLRQLRLLQLWIDIYKEKLAETWENAVNNIPFDKIEPLDVRGL
jgi:hypothetical protein